MDKTTIPQVGDVIVFIPEQCPHWDIGWVPIKRSAAWLIVGIVDQPIRSPIYSLKIQALYGPDAGVIHGPVYVYQREFKIDVFLTAARRACANP